MNNVANIVDTLYQLNIKEVLLNELLSKHTTIKIGGMANLFVKIKSARQLKDCIKFFNENNINYYVLGRGSNILAGDDGFNGAIISLSNSLNKYKILEDGIYAEAGVGLFELNRICRTFGFGGLEFSYGIPGSVGGAVCMNAGSFGYSIGDFVEYVRVIENNKFKKLKKEQMQFAYRKSIVQNKGIIVVGVKFKLEKKDKKEIENLQNIYFHKKLETQPYSELSFGSVFKRNNSFEPVSKLIDKLGLKGFSIGGASISEKHAGFIINKRNATCKDCLKLIQYIKQQIRAKYNFEPELEVELLGVKNIDDFIR